MPKTTRMGWAGIAIIAAALTTATATGGVAAPDPPGTPAVPDRSFALVAGPDAVSVEGAGADLPRLDLQALAGLCPEFQELCEKCYDLCGKFCKGCLIKQCSCRLDQNIIGTNCQCEAQCFGCTLGADRFEALLSLHADAAAVAAAPAPAPR